MGPILVVAAAILLAAVIIGMVVIGVLFFSGDTGEMDLAGVGCILAILGIGAGIAVFYFALQYASQGTLHLPF